MSNPSEVSEKAVWLENNMPRWLVHCNNDSINDVHDVVSEVLAHLSAHGVEILYSLMTQLLGDAGIITTSTDERLHNYGELDNDHV